MFLGKGREFLKKAAKIMKKYSKVAVTLCPNCGEQVDTLIFSQGHVMCPLCQKKNILDGFSMLAKMPEGKEKVHAVFCKINNEHPENNVEITGPKIINEISGKKAFGYLKIPISDKILTEKNADKFLEEYIAMAVLVDRKTYEKVFGTKIAIKKDDLIVPEKPLKKEDIN